MGMLGSYTAIENSMLNQILNGEESDTGFEKCQYLDIDKSWQLIHFLLCKNTENGKPPMGYVVPMSDENELDFGYSDARIFYLTKQQVKEASDYLNSLSDDTLKNMYDFKEMQENGVYPIDKNEPDTGLYEYIYFYLTAVRKFFLQTAEKEYAIIFSVC